MHFLRLFDLRLLGLVFFFYSWCLERTAACDFGTIWTFPLLVLFKKKKMCNLELLEIRIR